MQEWISIKAYFQSLIGISNDALHVLLSVPALIILALLMRRPIWSWTSWAALLALEMANELVTGFADGRMEDWEAAGSIRDVPLVMAVPTMLLACRLVPLLYKPRPVAADAVPIWHRRRTEIIDAEYEEIS